MKANKMSINYLPWFVFCCFIMKLLNSVIIPSVIVGDKISSGPLRGHWGFRANSEKPEAAPFSNIDNLTE